MTDAEEPESGAADGDANAEVAGDATETGESDDEESAAPAEESAASTERAADAAEDAPADASEESPEPVVVPGDVADAEDGGFLANVVNVRQQLGAAAEAFRNARGVGSLPADDAGRVRIVCRRYAERRAVALDDRARPACYDAEHPDCQGCLEDVRDGSVETW